MEGLDPKHLGNGGFRPQTFGNARSKPKEPEGPGPKPKDPNPKPKGGTLRFRLERLQVAKWQTTSKIQTPNPKGGPLGLDLSDVQVAKWFKVWGHSLYA